jgi:hypothetical protein
MTNLKKVLWTISLILPIAIWLLVYQALFTSDLLVETVTFIMGAILLSFVTVGALLLLRRVDRETFKKAKLMKIFIIVFGTPITFLLPWAYVTFIALSYKWTQDISTKDGSYRLSKYQNFFTSKYIYHENNSDTLVVTVGRDSNVRSLMKLKNGEEVMTNSESIPNWQDLMDRGLFRYDK